MDGWLSVGKEEEKSNSIGDRRGGWRRGDEYKRREGWGKVGGRGEWS